MLLPLLLAAFVAVAQGYNSYLIVAPNTVRPGASLDLSVTILDAQAPVRVQAKIKKDNSDFVVVTKQFSNTAPGTLSLKMPNDATNGRYQLEVQGSGGLTFTNTTNLKFSAKGFSVYIQTDKGIYKPGQTVHFRVFATYPDLRPYTGTFNINIFDPSGNKMKQMVGVSEATGVISDQLVMTDQPVLGDWKIKVDAGAQKTEATFAVDEYVLPKYEVKVSLPSFAVDSDAELSGHVEAKYTYGKGVVGTATVRATVEPFYKRNNDQIQPAIERSFQIDEKHDFKFTLAEMRTMNQYLNGKRLVVTANVTETLTGTTLTGKSEVKFYNKRAKLEWAKSNPANFKPGLKFNAIVKLLQQDGSPLTTGNRQLVVKRVYVWERKPQVVQGGTGPPTTITTRSPWDWWRPIDYVRRNAPDLTLTADNNGIIMIQDDTDPQAEKIELTVQYQAENVRLSKTIKKMHSPSNSFLQINLASAAAVRAGNRLSIEVKSTTPVRRIYYQVIARGATVATGSAALPYRRRSSSQTFSLPITSKMAPSARLMVYYIRNDGEVVNDALNFNVEGAFENQVSLTMSLAKAEPGENITVTVSADRGSYVGLVAVDQSTLLLRSANDITPDKVLGELDQYDTVKTPGWSPRGPWGGPVALGRKKRSVWWPWHPISVSGDDAKAVFENSGLIYLTDTLVYDYVEPPRWRRPPIFWARGGPEMAFGMPGMPGPSAGIPGPSADNLLPSPRDAKVPEKPVQVRSNFPETWLWTSKNLPSSGSITIESQVPDTITSWVASAFALNAQTGLGVVDSPYKLEVFRPFFVSLNLPYSVVRGEKVILQATVFNYLNTDLNVVVTLEGSADYEVTMKDASGRVVSLANTPATISIHIPAGKGRTALFPITATSLGHIPLKVKAQSPLAADALERKLLVEPEGVEQEYTESFLISLTQGETFNTKMPIEFPPSLVAGSNRVTITAQGDLMGPTVNNLDKLLKMPYGCGEQNMLNFAPNIFIARYLSATGQLSDAIKAKAVNFMTKGYQREMTYQHKDGSFSAFGDRDPSGSMWLTAFVVKSFHQAKPFIYIDPEGIDRAVRWMVTKQNADGTFPEPGRVIHKDMQGGSASGDSLTAYVLITLLETDDLTAPLSGDVNRAIQNAVRYLESRAATLSDRYSLSILHYALTLAGSSRATTVRNRLNALAVVDGGKKHWKKPEVTQPTTSHNYWHPRHQSSKAVNIEMTSYNLLTYVELDDINGGIPIMRWLTEQRNGQGGFVSTQDTVLALQALGEFAALVYSPGGNMAVDVKALPQTKRFSIDATNALVLQSFHPTNVPSEVEVSASGAGMALVQVTVNYNVIAVPVEPSFEITTSIEKETKEEIVVKVCTRYTAGGESGMAVIEHGVLSGFVLDKESLGDGVQGLKRVELDGKKANLYFDAFSSTPICYTASLVRTDLVAKTKPAAIKVYDYYSPDEQVTVYYTSRLLENIDVCDICVECNTICS